jgi:hypothetical protein
MYVQKLRQSCNYAVCLFSVKQAWWIDVAADNFDNLVPGLPPFKELSVAQWHVKQFSDEFQQCLIGASFDWRGGKLYLEGIAVQPDDFVAFSARLDVQRKRDDLTISAIPTGLHRIIQSRRTARLSSIANGTRRMIWQSTSRNNGDKSTLPIKGKKRCSGRKKRWVIAASSGAIGV